MKFEIKRRKNSNPKVEILVFNSEELKGSIQTDRFPWSEDRLKLKKLIDFLRETIK